MHNTDITNLNIQHCELGLINSQVLKHTTTLKDSIDTPKYNNHETSCVTVKNKCVQYEEYYTDVKAVMSPISQLSSNIQIEHVIKIIREIITTFITLEHNNERFIGKDKKLLTPKMFCDYIFHFTMTSNDTPKIIITQKYLIENNKKNIQRLLYQVLFHFLCRPTTKNQETCTTNSRCLLKKHTSYFELFPEYLVHQTFCTAANSTQHLKSIFFDHGNI